LILIPSWAAAKPPKPAPPGDPVAAAELSDLKGGRYTVKLSGLVCSVCTRAITAELSQLKEVEAATADFERAELTIKVRPDKVLTLSKLRSTLKRAAKRANLGATYTVESVRYRPL